MSSLFNQYTKYFYYRASNELMWCVLSDEELNKCEEFARSTEKDQMDTNEEAFGSYYRKVFQISALEPRW